MTLEDLECLSPDDLGDILLDEIIKNNMDLECIEHILFLCPNLNITANGKYLSISKYRGSGADDRLFKMISKDNKTAMHLAAEYGKYWAMVLLIDAGASIEVKDNNGLTPLHYAAMMLNYDIIKLLIGVGASKEAKTNDGYTPWDFLYENNRNIVPELNPYND